MRNAEVRAFTVETVYIKHVTWVMLPPSQLAFLRGNIKTWR
jgi:hypothetical protein